MVHALRRAWIRSHLRHKPASCTPGGRGTRRGKGARVQGGLSARVREAMVNALAEAGWADEPNTRRLLIQTIGDDLDLVLPVPLHPLGIDHLRAVVDTCCNTIGGLGALLRAVRLMLPGSREYAKIEHLIERAWVLDVLSEPELRRLQSWLVDLRVPDMATLVRRSSGPGVPPPEPDADAWTAFLHLVDYNAGADGIPPCLVFVELLVRQIDKSLATSLAQWNADQARTLGLERELSARRELLPAPSASDARLHLLIAVEQDAIDPDIVMVSYWRQNDPEQWPPARSDTEIVPLSNLERCVDDIILAAERAWSGHEGSVSVEFLLPRALLNLPVQRWHKEHDSGDPRPLCLDYPVVVRSLERMKQTEWHRPWPGRWKAMTNSPATTGLHIATWDDTSVPHRLDAILSDPQFVSMLLTAPPSTTPRPRADELTAALRAGLPVLFWHCELSTSEVLREVVSRLVEDNGLRELPARLLGLRRKALIGGDDLATLRDLVVLFDDPSRLVPLN